MAAQKSREGKRNVSLFYLEQILEDLTDWCRACDVTKEEMFGRALTHLAATQLSQLAADHPDPEVTLNRKVLANTLNRIIDNMQRNLLTGSLSMISQRTRTKIPPVANTSDIAIVEGLEAAIKNKMLSRKRWLAEFGMEPPTLEHLEIRAQKLGRPPKAENIPPGDGQIPNFRLAENYNGPPLDLPNDFHTGDDEIPDFGVEDDRPLPEVHGDEDPTAENLL